jgi:hypothetical protein
VIRTSAHYSAPERPQASDIAHGVSRAASVGPSYEIRLVRRSAFEQCSGSGNGDLARGGVALKSVQEPEAKRNAKANAERGIRSDETRWQLHQVDIDEFAWYCPKCAEREFSEES